MWAQICRVVGCVAFALVSCLSVQAQQQGDLRALIGEAVKSGQKRVVIPRGVYRVAPEGNAGALITISKARDVEIVADGVMMVCTKRMRAIQINQSENLTLRGLTVDYDPLTFTQGKVVKIAEDKGWLDIKIDKGYPQIAYDRIVICDPKTRFHKYGINHLWGTKASWTEPGIVRITLKDVGQNVDLGDPVALSGGQEMGDCHGITVENHCSNVVFRGVTIHCAPGMGLVDFNNETGIQMFDCKIVPGPKPVGATEERLLTTSWDGIQCNVARVGAQIGNCVIERCGDDSWSVPTREFKVMQHDGKVLLFRAPQYGPADGGLRVGDHLQWRSGMKTETQEIVALREVDKGKVGMLIEATVKGEFGAQEGDYVFNQDCSSKGFIYRNNKIYSHGRGALVKVSEGLIEGNTFRGCDKAIMVNCELARGAGIADHLIIRGNTIIETGYHQAMPWSEQAGAICLSSSIGGGKLRAPGIFDDILIENNTFDRVKGLNLFISSAHNVMVRNNRFLSPHSTDLERHNGADYNIDATAVIEVTESNGVEFIGNTVHNKGPFTKQILRIEPSAKNVVYGDEEMREEK